MIAIIRWLSNSEPVWPRGEMCSTTVVAALAARLRTREVAYQDADEMIVTTGMSDRKDILIRESDAFVILAGGFGTLDELLDVITTKQLGYHSKPIAILNTDGFFDRQLQMFDHIVSQRFAGSSQLKLFEVCSTVPEVFKHLDAQPCADSHHD